MLGGIILFRIKWPTNQRKYNKVQSSAAGSRLLLFCYNILQNFNWQNILANKSVPFFFDDLYDERLDWKREKRANPYQLSSSHISQIKLDVLIILSPFYYTCVKMKKSKEKIYIKTCLLHLKNETKQVFFVLVYYVLGFVAIILTKNIKVYKKW